jgi:glycosyltransferase involved in cell wall biosynthesis
MKPEKSMKEFIEKTNKHNQTIKIAIDGNEANVSSRVGSNVYAFEIIKSLHTLVRNKSVKVTILLSTPPIKELPKENKKWKYKVITPQKFWTQWALPIHLFLHSDDYDIFYTPGHYAPRLSSIPYVSSIMDLAFLNYENQFKKKDFIQLKKWTKYSVKNAKKIITISEATKRDVMEQYGRTKQDVIVAYPAVNHKKEKIPPIHIKKVLNKFKIDQPFILYVGTIQPRKNIIKLIESFEKVSRRLPVGKRKKIKSLQLVIAGKVGWLADDVLKRVEESPYKNQIIMAGFVTDFEKNVLLSECETLVLVGLYEGFGIPPLEALHYSIIPVVSDTSSLPEVVGKAGLLANPNNTTEIAEKIEEVITLTLREKQKYINPRRSQIAKFDWKNSARIIYKTLEKVAHENS